MNNLTSLQRKLVYLGGVVLLLIPITMLGLPPEPARPGAPNSGSTGGKLAIERVNHQLGESNLGKVDPASSTMNLLLLGFRGIATSILWMEAQDQQKYKDWAGLRATTDSIILLQPHFLKVWHFQGWNLAYNVSAEWDLVSDRFYWVKEGIKFFQDGKERNDKHPELYWYVGDTIGKKVGRADEWKQFRRFFRKDPDTTRYKEGPDPRINPEGKDNYLVAKDWFTQANSIVDRYPNNQQHIMALILFRSYPERAQMDYATSLQRDGIFDEVARTAWDDAFREWTTRYGRENFDASFGTTFVGNVHLEVSDEEMAQIREFDKQQTQPMLQLETWIKKYQDMTNYRFWRTRAKVEAEPTMAEAHRKLYEGQKAYLAADFHTAQELLVDGMKKLELMIEEYPDLKADDNTIEEAMLAQLFWRACLDIDNEQPDESKGFPLQELWTKEQNRLGTIIEEFNRRKRTAQ